MQEWLIFATDKAVFLISAMALVVILIGTVEAFIGGILAMLAGPKSRHEESGVWLRFARWLVVGLSFQLAADIIETSVAPTWEDIGRLAAIAAIRTALNFFLERDIAEMRKRRETRLDRQDFAGGGQLR